MYWNIIMSKADIQLELERAIMNQDKGLVKALMAKLLLIALKGTN